MKKSGSSLEITCVCGNIIQCKTGAPAVCQSCGAEFLIEQAEEDSFVPGHTPIPSKRTRCDACGAPLDLAAAEQRDEAFVICQHCGTQYDRNDSQVLDWGEFVPTGVEMTRIEVPTDDEFVPQFWELDGKRFKSLEALERHLRSQYPDEIVDKMIAAMRGRD